MGDCLRVRNLSFDDVSDVVFLTEKEGWVSGEEEFLHLISVNSRGCFALVQGNKLIGVITTYVYKWSGWIGNFIVASPYRNQGLGRKLLERALDYLLGEKRVRTVYLTAAPKAISLYKRYGFREIGHINRWRKTVIPGEGKITEEISASTTWKRIIMLDRKKWHDDRSIYIKELWPRAICFEHEKPYGFIMATRIKRYTVIGPWEVEVEDILVAEKMLKGIYATVRKTQPVVLDTPAANEVVSALLAHHGFTRVGQTALMCYGAVPAVDFNGIYALASMGSLG